MPKKPDARGRYLEARQPAATLAAEARADQASGPRPAATRDLSGPVPGASAAALVGAGQGGAG